MDRSEERFVVQDSRYGFPYHHLPHRITPDSYAIGRWLSWGLEYLVYQEFVAQMIRGLAPHSILEVGCGDGRLVGLLADTVPVRVGADLSRRAIAFARAFHPDATFFCQSTDDLTGQYDVVVAVEVLEHVPDADVQRFLHGLRERVAPGGALILSVPTTVLKPNPKHYRHYTLPLLVHQLQSAGIDTLNMVSHFVFREDWLLRFFRRATLNRYWVLEVPLINRYMWAHACKNCVNADALTGRHLVVCLRP